MRHVSSELSNGSERHCTTQSQVSITVLYKLTSIIAALVRSCWGEYAAKQIHIGESLYYESLVSSAHGNPHLGVLEGFDVYGQFLNPFVDSSVSMLEGFEEYLYKLEKCLLCQFAVGRLAGRVGNLEKCIPDIQ